MTDPTQPIALSAAEAREQFCYLITTGRVSGKAHEIEMWFATHPDGTDMTAVYCLSGGRDRSDWVKNVRANPALKIRIGPTTYAATGAVIEREAEEPRAREALAAKYHGWSGGELPNEWAKESLPVGFRLVGVAES